MLSEALVPLPLITKPLPSLLVTLVFSISTLLPLIVIAVPLFPLTVVSETLTPPPLTIIASPSLSSNWVLLRLVPLPLIVITVPLLSARRLLFIVALLPLISIPWPLFPVTLTFSILALSPLTVTKVPLILVAVLSLKALLVIEALFPSTVIAAPSGATLPSTLTPSNLASFPVINTALVTAFAVLLVKLVSLIVVLPPAIFNPPPTSALFSLNSHPSITTLSPSTLPPAASVALLLVKLDFLISALLNDANPAQLSAVLLVKSQSSTIKVPSQ